MYRLAIFALVSCVASQRLVGAVRKAESPSGRGHLFFDSYDQPTLEQFEESEDGLRDAVLMHPEQVLDVPPIPVQRDYEMEDPNTAELLVEERPYQTVWDSQMKRGFFQHLLEEIQAAFSNWPPKLPNEQAPIPGYYYHFDRSLLDTQITELKLLLATVEEKTCTAVMEKEESPKIIFMGTQGCSIEAVENKIVIGYECFEPTMILKLIFRLFGICPANTLVPTFKANSRPLYIDSYRSKTQRQAEEETDCEDKLGFCSFFVKGNSSFPCSFSNDVVKSMCSRTCRICGDSCVDYDPDCNTPDVLKDCLTNWPEKKIRCARTCGVCTKRKESGLCIDYYGCCRYYAQRGYCQKLPQVMKKFCALSCGYCKAKSYYEVNSMGGCQEQADSTGRCCLGKCNHCRNGATNRENEEGGSPENCILDADFVHRYCSWNPFIAD